MGILLKVALGALVGFGLIVLFYFFDETEKELADIPLEVAENEKAGAVLPASFLSATTNPEGGANDGIMAITLDLNKELKKFTGLTDLSTIESLAFDSAGTAYITAGINAENGAIVVVKDFKNSTTIVGGESKLIRGGKTGLSAPKGLFVSDSLNSIIVADFQAKDIKVFGLKADGDMTPLHSISLGSGERSVWDVTYVKNEDTLYAAGTDGTVLAYERFSVDFGKNGPVRTFVPTDQGQKISVNLHGIDTFIKDSLTYLALSDVGDAGSPNDGQLFVIENPSKASGNVQVIHRIAGTNTKLGNPVDLVIDPSGGTYVAEKSNDLILFYENLWSNKGGMAMDMLADNMMSYSKPESVSLGSEE